MRETVSTVLRDRATRLGLVAGISLSLLGLCVYIGLPLLSGEERFLSNAAMAAGFDMVGYPLWYHGVVIVLPSSIASLLGTLLLYRSGLTGRGPATRLLGGIIGVPILVILLAYLVTAVAIGVIGGVTGGGEDPFGPVFGVFAFTGLSLVFGLTAVRYALEIVIPGLILGTATGFVIGYSLRRISGH